MCNIFGFYTNFLLPFIQSFFYFKLSTLLLEKENDDDDTIPYPNNEVIEDDEDETIDDETTSREELDEIRTLLQMRTLSINPAEQVRHSRYANTTSISCCIVISLPS